MLIADAGITRGNGKVLILTSTGTRVIAEGFKPPFGPVDEVFIAEFGSEAPNTTGGKPAPRVESLCHLVKKSINYTYIIPY